MVPVAESAASRRLLLTIMLAVLLTACASPAPVPRDRFFALEARPAAKSNTGSVRPAVTLRVEELSARGFLGGRQIVFRTEQAPLEVQRYPQLLWEEPPGRALAAEMIAALREGRAFGVVLGTEQRARADYALGGELMRFEHRPTAIPPHVEAEFSLTLTRNSDRRALLNRRYQGDERTDAPTPEAMVRAFNRLASRLIGEAVADIGNPSGQL
jgi:cholesterol transport system auxiliary component